MKTSISIVIMMPLDFITTQSKYSDESYFLQEEASEVNKCKPT